MVGKRGLWEPRHTYYSLRYGDMEEKKEFVINYLQLFLDKPQFTVNYTYNIMNEWMKDKYIDES